MKKVRVQKMHMSIQTKDKENTKTIFITWSSYEYGAVIGTNSVVGSDISPYTIAVEIHAE